MGTPFTSSPSSHGYKTASKTRNNHLLLSLWLYGSLHYIRTAASKTVLSVHIIHQFGQQTSRLWGVCGALLAPAKTTTIESIFYK